MREQAFRAYLIACKYTDNSVASRLSRLRLIERRLHADLDRLDLSAVGLLAIRKQLERTGLEGPQLANILNAARNYGRFRSGEGPTSSTAIRRTTGPRSKPSQTAASAEPEVTRPERPAFIQRATVPELMKLHGELLEELRSRGALRTANGPVGDYAEHLFAHAFGWQLEQASVTGHDAVDAKDVRYQIKGRRLTGIGSRQLGVIRRIDERAFDVLAAALFTSDMRVSRAALIPFHVVLARAKGVEHVNGWRFMLSDRVWDVPGVIDVTTELRAVSG